MGLRGPAKAYGLQPRGPPRRYVMEDRPISFPEWKTALMRAGLAIHEREVFRREILTFLRHCKVRRAPATIAGAREYLADRESLTSGRGPGGGSRASLRPARCGA